MARRRRRNGASTLIAVLVLVLVVLGVAVGGRGRPAHPRRAEPKVAVEEGQPVTVVIASGATTKTIAEQLDKAGVVATPSKFVTASRTPDVGADLKAGTYELTTGMPDDVVIEALVTGPVVKYTKVTIPEGFTNRQVALRVEKARVSLPRSSSRSLTTGAAKFSAEHPYLAKAYNGSLQGYLFPKTYEIKEGASAADVIEMMLDQFDKETVGHRPDLREVARARPQRGRRRGVDHRARGQGSQGAAAGVLGHLQPAEDRDEAADVLDGAVHPRNDPVQAHEPGHRDAEPLQHLPAPGASSWPHREPGSRGA